jgi:hypothetical protein
MTGGSSEACGREGLVETGAGIREPAAILARPELRAVIDTRQPAGAVTGMMHFFPVGGARRIRAEVSGVVAAPALTGACVLAGPGRVPGR